MAYIVDPINNTLIDDEKPFKKKKYKQLEFDFNEVQQESLELFLQELIQFRDTTTEEKLKI